MKTANVSKKYNTAMPIKVVVEIPGQITDFFSLFPSQVNANLMHDHVNTHTITKLYNYYTWN